MKRKINEYVVGVVGLIGFLLIFYGMAAADGGANIVKATALSGIGLLILFAIVIVGHYVTFYYPHSDDFWEDDDEEDKW